MNRLILVALLACGSRPPVGPTGGTIGGGAVSGVAPAGGAACESLRSKVEQLYRAEAAKAREQDPARVNGAGKEAVNQAVADNTTMVMNDCVRAPGTAMACITAATTVRELQARCLIPIDEEGTEGDQLAH